jgi:hypothetical protein
LKILGRTEVLENSEKQFDRSAWTSPISHFASIPGSSHDWMVMQLPGNALQFNLFQYVIL